uniref:ABC transporter domain-containing protein n=1 Tax=Mucochytrium quahogii TaxID=96639 RepID=A0A7S2RU54_9STRA|mmetsp:Transcript_9452/g.15465  ORF Transcript_9452/g.15465 Transcript_9452/m.15465 type:complete len:740 (+) Transcript_9452:315-2534(+)|eukprot:CAMPEP_0203749138 /NCGR_PEP_ID=MMETSP0098-20131031/3805_1 /ASSEMBLY_ACC=CAM_ASM_000208 /TAXON_ID=96639 /ORGANISM=" , Strain NY0313808BC1" /LENGTH=739 /DNA_ID=CAMNT_0050638105 /DNA_START=275 /DNA_END=2494 /DNA_ORIENTATION=-
MSEEDVIRSHLKDLDEDILEYILGIAEGVDGGLGSADEDVLENVGQFLVSAEMCDDEDEAQLVVEKLVKALHDAGFGGSGASAQEDEDTGPRLLDNPLSFDKHVIEDDFNLKSSKAMNNRNETIEVSETKLKKAELRKIQREIKEREAMAAERAAQEEAVGVSTFQITSVDGDDFGVGPATDLVLPRFDLPNKKGSGPDLLVNANITFSQGRRYGLVGRNGCGKSTLLSAINERSLDSLKWCKQSILLVKQEVEGNSLTPLEWVMGSDGRPALLKARIEELLKSDDASAIEKLTGLQEQLVQLEATKGEAEAAKMLYGIGFDANMQHVPTSSLSGGWRRRVALACSLFVEPQILMLDEPTNHLDLETVCWLEQYLTTKYHGTLIVVSHDRNFLNTVVTDIVDFAQNKLTVYKGDFLSYLETKEQDRITKARQREAQEMKRAHMTEYIIKHAKAGENGPKAARQRKSRMKKLERLGVEAAAQSKGGKFKASYDGDAEDVEEEVDEDEFELKFPEVAKVDGTILRLDDVEFAYPGSKPILKNLSINFDIKSRIAILGKNGCGKSTFLKVALGLLEPTHGSVIVKQNCRIGYISQHHSEALDVEKSALDILLDKFPGDHSQSHTLEMRSYLAQFGLGGQTLPLQKVTKLSGGQKFRVALAICLYRAPHFLVLDEPSNHLDVATINALIEAITKFKGGIVVVSHDQHLLERSCSDLYILGDGKLERFDGGFAKYRKSILQNKK